MSPVNPSGPENPDITQRRLLQSVVEVARSVFGAAAASVFLIDRSTGELVFEAVAGEGEPLLPGTRIPGGTGIAGWAVATGQPVLVDDVDGNPRFARKAAEATGYVPHGIMAAPLIADGECVGVLEVLDRDSRPRCDLGDMDSLGLLATEIATALELLVRVRELDEDAGNAAADLVLLRRVAERMPGAPEHVRVTVSRLLATADELLAGTGSMTHA